MIDLGGGDQEGIRKQLEEASAQKKLFEKCMGLKFVITEGELWAEVLIHFTVDCALPNTHHADRALSFVFTNVDPDNPGKKFTITLDMDEEQLTGENRCLSTLWPPSWPFWKGNDLERLLLSFIWANWP